MLLLQLLYKIKPINTQVAEQAVQSQWAEIQAGVSLTKMCTKLRSFNVNRIEVAEQCTGWNNRALHQ